MSEDFIWEAWNGRIAEFLEQRKGELSAEIGEIYSRAQSAGLNRTIIHKTIIYKAIRDLCEREIPLRANKSWRNFSKLLAENGVQIDRQTSHVVKTALQHQIVMTTEEVAQHLIPAANFTGERLEPLDEVAGYALSAVETKIDTTVEDS